MSKDFKNSKPSKKMKKYLFTLLFTLAAMTASAQCPLTNKAFTSGEYLTYNLYFNWKFVWVKVGTATMSTISTKYDGQPAFKSTLITRGNGKLDKYFVMRDTLIGYVTPTLSPLYFRKGSVEQDRYTVDEVWYTYNNGTCNLKMHRQKADGTHQRFAKSSEQCVYDMLNLFSRARNFNTDGWTKGHTIKVPVADGNGMTTATLKYMGKEKVKGDNDITYMCLKLEYSEYVEKKKKWKTYGTFFVTDDNKHVPVRLDVDLKYCSYCCYAPSRWFLF